MAFELAKTTEYVGWSNGARAIWEEHYPALTAPRPGALGSVVNRAEAHALRLAVLTAVINEGRFIEPEHLQAALAIVAYSERSAAYILGDRLGDRDEEAILGFLRGKLFGATRTEIRRGVLNDHKPAALVTEKLTSLLRRGLVRYEHQPTEGRPREVWFAVDAQREKREKRGNAPPCGAFHANHAYHAGGNGKSVAPDREVFEL